MYLVLALFKAAFRKENKFYYIFHYFELPPVVNIQRKNSLEFLPTVAPKTTDSIVNLLYVERISDRDQLIYIISWPR